MRGGVSDDDDVAAPGRLGNGLADQRSDVFGPYDFDGGRRRKRPGVPASLGERIEQAPRVRLAALLVGDFSRLEASRGGSSGDDVLVDVEIAEPLRDLFPDLVSARAGRMRDTHNAARHDTTLEPGAHRSQMQAEGRTLRSNAVRCCGGTRTFTGEGTR